MKYRKQSRKKGMTLVEIIVAIALLGIISVMLYPALTGQYKLLRSTRTMTEDLYAAQQDIEVAINDIKTAIQAEAIPANATPASYDLFDGTSYARRVGGYASNIDVHLGNSAIQLVAVVADSQLSAFPTSTIASAVIALEDINGGQDFAYWNNPSLRVISNYTEPDPADINMYNICRWYVSRAGFNSPTIADPLEIEIGSVYPRFPEDYTVISNYLLTDLNSIAREYAGRHIIFTVTPVSTDYKTGKTTVSNAVFINGLPYSDNLALHLDASMISPDDTAAVRTVDNGSSNSYFVARWADISGNSNDATQPTASRQPEMVPFKVADIEIDGDIYESYARLVRFSGTQSMTVSNDSSLNNNSMTLLIVARSSDMTAGKTILSKLTGSGAGWFFGWTAADQLGFSLRNAAGGGNTASLPAGSGLDSQWHILTAATSTSGGQVSVQIDSGPAISTGRTIASFTNNSAISLGFNGSLDFANVDVAEVLMYSGTLSTDNLSAVYSYLDNKYNPDPADISIYALKPFTASVALGESFTLPSSLNAYMSNGSIRSVAVTWSPTSIVDTSTPGTYTFTATAVDNPDKTTTGEVTVASIVSLADQSMTVQKDEACSLPGTATATMSDGAAHNVAVNWYNIAGDPVGSSVNTSTVGVQTFTGRAVLDPTRSMTMTVNVVPTRVTGVTVNPASVSNMSIGQTAQLTATVSPADAFIQDVTWSSSDPSVATVSDTGLVTAVGGGTATVSVTTVDGGFTATSTINVNIPVNGISLSPAVKVIRRNASFQLTATISPANAGNQSITWSSSNTAAVTVSNTGVVVARGNWGQTATITASTVDGNYSATCQITIGMPVSGVEMSENTRRILIGETIELNYTVHPNSGGNQATNQSVTWSSNNPAVATVDSNGNVTGVSMGTAEITVTTVDGGFTDTCTVEVDWGAVSISSGSASSFTLTFNTTMAAGLLNGATCTVSGNTLRFDSNSGNFQSNTNLTVQAVAADGSVKYIVVRRARGSTNWSIQNQYDG